ANETANRQVLEEELGGLQREMIELRREKKEMEEEMNSNEIQASKIARKTATRRVLEEEMAELQRDMDQLKETMEGWRERKQLQAADAAMHGLIGGVLEMENEERRT
ncbi:hypothetical protein PFISCL1PPCAC_6649, partial [Pristionchus fissidentatus]